MITKATYITRAYFLRITPIRVLTVLLLFNFIFSSTLVYSSNNNRVIKISTKLDPASAQYQKVCTNLMIDANKLKKKLKKVKLDPNISVEQLFTSSIRFQQYLKDKGLLVSYNVAVSHQPDAQAEHMEKLRGLPAAVTMPSSVNPAISKLAFFTYIVLQYIVYPNTIDEDKINSIISIIRKKSTTSSDATLQKNKENQLLDNILEVLGISDIKEALPRLIDEYRKKDSLLEKDSMIPILDDLRYLYSFSTSNVPVNKDLNRIINIFKNFIPWLNHLTNSVILYKFLTNRSFQIENPELALAKDELVDYLIVNSQKWFMNLTNALTPTEFKTVLSANTYNYLPFILDDSNFLKMENVDINSNWGLSFLFFDPYIKNIEKQVSIPECPINSSLDIIDFSSILSYFDQNAQELYSKFIKLFVSKEQDSNLNLDKNINLISFIESIYIWALKVKSIQDLDKKRIKQEIHKMIDKVFERYINLDEFQKFFFIWTLKHVSYTSVVFSNESGLNILDSVLSILSGFLITHPEKLSEKEIKTLVNISLVGPYLPTILKNLFTDINIDHDNFYLTLKFILSNELYIPHLSNIKDLIDRDDFNLNVSLERIDFKSANIFLRLLVQEIKTPKELAKILSSNLHDSYLKVFLEQFDTTKFIKSYPNLTEDIESSLLSNELLINIASSLSSNSKLYAKDFIEFVHYYLNQKSSYTNREWQFITQYPSKLKYDYSKLSSVTLKEIIDLLVGSSSWFESSYTEVTSIILSKDILEFDNIPDTELSNLIKKIIVNLSEDQKSNIDTTKIDTILTRNPSILDEIISECTKPSYSVSLTKIKTYLLDHLFIAKPVKIKRQVESKSISIKKTPEYSDQVSSLLEEIEEQKYSSNSFDKVESLIQLFTKLIDIQNSHTGGKGQKIYIDVENALNIILNFFKNFNYNTYPQFKDYLFSKISPTIWNFLYSHKINVYKFLSAWLTVSNLNVTQIVEVIKELYQRGSLKNDPLYSFIMSIFKNHFKSLNQAEISSLIEIVIYTLKADNTVINTNGNDQLKLFNVETITADLIPLLLKITNKQDKSNLLECIKTKLQTTTQTFGITEYDIHILQLNKRLIDSLLDLDNNTQIALLLSMLSTRALLYIKNTSDLYELLSPLLPEEISNTTSDVLTQSFLDTQKKLDSTPILTDRISDLFYEIDYQMTDFSTEESKAIRESASIAIILLNEIKSERLPLDLSDMSYFRVGYDILSVSANDTKYIEVKSKMALRSEEYPLLISYNEALKALEYTSYGKNPDIYKLYAVPLKPSEIEEFGEIIDLKIDYIKLQKAVKVLGEKRARDFANNIENYEKIPIAEIITDEQKSLLGL